ncbi:MAG TPA: hypothetical protein VFN55_10455 [Solirubrobacteraceae bacterium]|nr:hypothetical protein [Solirubrobacteraceae bacterium]
MKLSRSIRRALIATGLAVAMTTAVAVAAAPRKGGTYGECTKRTCLVNYIKVTANGRQIAVFRAFTKCNNIPFKKDPGGFEISRAGSFAFSGVRPDFAGNKVKVVITGKFVSPTLITGTMRYSADAPKRCDTGTIKYAAKLGKYGL